MAMRTRDVPDIRFRPDIRPFFIIRFRPKCWTAPDISQPDILLTYVLKYNSYSVNFLKSGQL